jgi:hypothetical protein
VERHGTAGVIEDGYWLEFFDMTGNTVALIALPARAVRVPTRGDLPTVRAVGLWAIELDQAVRETSCRWLWWWQAVPAEHAPST